MRVVLCWHQPLRKWDVTNEMLPYITQTYGPPRNFIYGIATQTYFGPSNPPANATAAQLVALCRPGIEGQVDEGPSTTNEAGRRQWLAAAQQYQLPGGLMSYEGGPGTAYGEGVLTNIGNAIQMHREPAMKAEVKYNLAQAWWDLGAGLAMQFTLSSSYQRFGQYGLTDDLNNPDRNSKYQAMRELVGGGPLATTPRLAARGALQLYPNPAVAAVRLRYAAPATQAARVEITNALGQVVQQRHVTLQVGANEVELSARPLAAGLYHVRLVSADGTVTQTLEVTR